MVKAHSGEKGNNNYPHLEFLREMIDYVQGTVLEYNTAYEGQKITLKSLTS